MFHFLGFLFIIIIAVLLIGLSIIGSVIQSIFKLGRPRANSGTHQYTGGYSYNNQQQSRTSSQEEEITNPEEGEIRPKRKKLFSKDEGEYVDFEEIKE